MARRQVTRSAARCPECGHANRPNARMCTRCLAPLAGTPGRALAVDRTDRDIAPSLREGYETRRPSRRSRTSRADALRQRVLGSARPTHRAQSKSGWLGDWKLGGMVLTFLGIIGLRQGGDLIDQVQEMNDGEGPFGNLF